MDKALADKHEDGSLDPQNHVKARQAWQPPTILALRRQRQGISEARPARLHELSRFSERPCLDDVKSRQE